MNQSFSKLTASHFPANRRSGVVGSMLLVGVVVCALLGALGYFFYNRGPVEPAFNPILASVQKGDFVAKVLDQGEIQSSENVEIRCEVRARNGQLTVIALAPEGSRVKPGDFLVRLDSTAFDKELETQRITVANAKAAVIQARATLSTAETTMEEYLQGTYKANLMQIENDITDALGLIDNSKQELLQAEAVLAHSRALQARGFITQRELEADKFAVARAELTVKRNENVLKLAKNQKEVLEKLTLVKEKVQLESNIEAAEVKLESEENALKVQEGQLAEILEMIKKCEIVVPEGVSGQVVYAKESRGRGEEWVLEEGANVRESQVLIRLPNANKMEVKALINEQNITQIEAGMPAQIKVDALTDMTLKGVVTKVNQYAESSGWGSSSVRKYAVKVRILDPPPALKPGMNASVFVQTKYVPDALMVPIQTIYGVQDRQFCLLKNGGKFETREIKVGANNSQMALILEGLEEGDQLVMNPGAFKDRMDLPEVKQDKRIEVPEDEIAEVKANKPKEEKPARSGGGGGMSADMIVNMVMQRSDKNSDGKLDKEEIAGLDGRSKSWSGTADSDGDGELSREEITKAMEKLMKSRGGGGRPGGGGRQSGGR